VACDDFSCVCFSVFWSPLVCVFVGGFSLTFFVLARIIERKEFLVKAQKCFLRLPTIFGGEFLSFRPSELKAF
jgi:hypothetical protein